MRKHILTGLLLSGLALSATAAEAADRTVKVRFKPGSSYASLKGSFKGYDAVNYVLDARAGQTISVLFSPSSASCYFNFYEPGAGARAAHIGSVAGNEYADTLNRNGRNRVQVYQMRSSARRNEVCRYSITFEISG
jgi:hypothetical protein